MTAAGAAIERELLSGKDYSMSQDSDEALARVAILAAAPMLAEAVASALREAAITEWDLTESDGGLQVDISFSQIAPTVQRVIEEACQ